MPTVHTPAATSVRAVERAVELLYRLGDAPGSASLQQLADAIGCSKSTVHRLLSTLERSEAVERDETRRGYRLGRRVRALARASLVQVDLRQAALPYMRELCERFGETVTLHRLEGLEHVVIEQCESAQEIRRTLRIGQRTPLLRGATAKAILAFLPPEEAAAVLGQTGMPEDPGPSAAELEDIRSLGYAFSLAERVPGGSTVSVPLHDRLGHVCGALSIPGPSFRFTPARATRCAPALVDAAAHISAAL